MSHSEGLYTAEEKLDPISMYRVQYETNTLY